MANTKTLPAAIREHYSFQYPATWAFIDRVAEEFERKFYNIYTPDSKEDWADAIDSLGALGNFIEDRNGNTPDVFFGEPGYGHFKECYTFSPHFIIKFCSRRNPTDREVTLLQKAKAWGLGRVFLDTLFFDLPVYKDPAVLEPDDDEDLVYNTKYHFWEHDPSVPFDNELVSLEIQPVAETIAPGDCTDDHLNAEFQCWSLSQWHNEPLSHRVPEDFNPYQIRFLSGASRLWIEDYFNRYGLEALVELAEFCEVHHVNDLHSANVGHCFYGSTKTYPVILDWMSR